MVGIAIQYGRSFWVESPRVLPDLEHGLLALLH